MNKRIYAVRLQNNTTRIIEVNLVYEEVLFDDEDKRELYFHSLDGLELVNNENIKHIFGEVTDK